MIWTLERMEEDWLKRIMGSDVRDVRLRGRSRIGWKGKRNVCGAKK